MERTALMVAVEVVMTDVAGLLEASLTVGDTTSEALGSEEKRHDVKRQLAAAEDAYVSVVLSTAGGDLTPERIARCRSEAEIRMPLALTTREELRRLVLAKRLPLVQWQDDLAQLALLSLELRQSLKGLSSAETFDDKSADPAANKVLVHLREAALAYLHSARLEPVERADDTTRARAAALAELEKASQHVTALVTLESQSADRDGPTATPAAALKHSVSEPLQKLIQQWQEPEQSIVHST